MAGEYGPQTFFDVFAVEAEAINRRREAIRTGRAARRRGHLPAPDPRPEPEVLVVERLTETESGPGVPCPDERGKPVPRLRAGHDLTGLALSGGGIRSASFCLGVLQALDAVRDDREPQVFDGIDYLSTVSGGGYIGTSLVAGLKQTGGRFPFSSKLDQQETLETQHLRDYSSFLTPGGAFDVLVGVLAVLRGIAINALLFFGIVLLAAALTATLNPTREILQYPAFLRSLKGDVFLWSALIGLSYLALQPVLLILFDRRRRAADLPTREWLGNAFAVAFLAWLVVVFLEAQAYVLAGLFEAHDPAAGPGSANGAARAIRAAGEALSSLWAGLLPAATVLVASLQKLTKVADAAASDPTRTGTVKRVASLAGIYLAATIVPLAAWAAYLALSFWAIAPADGLTPAGHLQAPALWRAPAEAVGSFAGLYGLLALAIAATGFFLRPNVGTLHGYYRDRLSRAFLWQRDRLEGAAQGRALQPSGADVDSFRFSSLKTEPDGSWSDDIGSAPYLLVNTAVNLESSKYLNRRGRNADNFLFSPCFAGSEATGYVGSRVLEDLDPTLNLGTAMAASGAAASANMGASTVKPLVFTFAALNLRLGYWLPNPAKAAGERGARPWYASVGPFYFALETLGRLDETRSNVYLTDGGHFDNLGLYELLKRRCRFVVAVDAEADPALNFTSLVRLERYARIDLGVRIDLPLDFLRRRALAVTAGRPHGEFDDSIHCNGPHVALGRVDYGPGEQGVLVYVKASMSGDESDLVRDYKRRNGDFPHETTIDQFFSEEQFEVYRALGFHAAKRFFAGEDQFACLAASDDPGWLDDVRAMLARLNVDARAIDRILARADREPERSRG